MDTFGAALKQADLVIISDYAKGCVPPDMIAEITAATRAAGKMVVVDPKLADFKAYAGASLLTPNLSEFRKTGLSRETLSRTSQRRRAALRQATAWMPSSSH